MHLEREYIFWKYDCNHAEENILFHSARNRIQPERTFQMIFSNDCCNLYLSTLSLGKALYKENILLLLLL